MQGTGSGKPKNARENLERPWRKLADPDTVWNPRGETPLKDGRAGGSRPGNGRTHQKYDTIFSSTVEAKELCTYLWITFDLRGESRIPQDFF